MGKPQAIVEWAQGKSGATMADLSNVSGRLSMPIQWQQLHQYSFPKLKVDLNPASINRLDALADTHSTDL
jgi:hypothetical protein